LVRGDPASAISNVNVLEKPTFLAFMGVIAFIVVDMAALRNDDEIWAAIAFGEG
jgi:hypothetical protein